MAKKITIKEWKSLTENERKICIKFAFPHMVSYYNQFDDTSNFPEEDEDMWGILQKNTKVAEDGRVSCGKWTTMFYVKK